MLRLALCCSGGVFVIHLEIRIPFKFYYFYDVTDGIKKIESVIQGGHFPSFGAYPPVQFIEQVLVLHRRMCVEIVLCQVALIV